MITQEERQKDSGNFPKIILLDTIGYCNLRCSMCGYRIMTRKKGRMDIELVYKLIDEIATEDKDARVWMVFIGEALILKDKLYEQIKYAKSKGLTDVVLNSNGNLMDEECSMGLINSGLDAIYIGIDAFSPETYSKMRVGGNYYKTMDNVQRLIELKKEYKASNPRIFVQFVETEENQDEVEGFKKYWVEHGVEVKIRPKVTWANTVDSYKVQDIDRYPCYWAMRSFNICWDGRVALCSVDYDAQYVAGNVNESSIKDIWLGNLKEIRDANIKGEYNRLPEFCKNCTDWQMAKATYYD